MQNETDPLLVQLRSGIENRINKQIERHRRVKSDPDTRTLIDLQISQEKEKLEIILENEENPNIAAVIKCLINDWLPQLAKQLKSR